MIMFVPHIVIFLEQASYIMSSYIFFFIIASFQYWIL